MIKKNNALDYVNTIFIIFYFPSFIISIAITNIFIITFLLINLIFNFIYFKNEIIKNFRISLYFLFFYILLLTSSLLSNHILFSLQSSLFYFLLLLYIFFIIIIFKKNQKLILTFLFCGISTLLIVSLDATFELISGKNIIGFSGAESGRIASFFGDRWVIGSYFVRIIPILIGVYLLNYSSISKNIKKLINFIFIFSFFIIIFSGERKAYLLLILYVFILLIYFIRTSKFKNLKLILPSLLIFFSLPFLLEFSNERLLHQIKHHTTNLNVFENQYYALFTTSINMFKKNPIIGVGPNNFRNTCYDRDYVESNFSCNTHPHNTLLQLLSEIGLIGAIMVYSIFVFFLYKIFISIKKSNKFEFDTFGLISIKSAIIINLWPIIPTGNFFLSWYGWIYFLPIAIYLVYIEKQNYSQ